MNKDKQRKYFKEWYTKNVTQVAVRMKKHNTKNKITVISHYTDDNCCVLCGESNINVLTVDHVGGGGRKQQKDINCGTGYKLYRWLIKKNFPSGYRILCANCNHKDEIVRLKRNRNIPWSRQVVLNDKRKILVFNQYGGKCVKCHISDYDMLQMDHVNNDGATHRRERGNKSGIKYSWIIKNMFPKNLQPLCANCNLIKQLKTYK